MKSIIRFSMRNGLALFLILFLIIGGGIYSVKTLHIEKYPNVDIPYLTVVIPYPGASPEQSMNDIGEKMEKEFMNLEGAKNVYTDGLANVVYSTIEFDMSMDMKEAERLARASIDKIQMPDLAGTPEFNHSSPEDPVVFSMGIYTEKNVEAVQKFVNENIVPRFEGIEGVSEVKVGGFTEKTVNIRLLPKQLEAKGVTVDDVKSAILANNLSVPTGKLSISNQVLPVRINKDLTSIDDIKQIKLFSRGGNPEAPAVKPISLKDIADINYDGAFTDNITRINAKQGVSFGIIAEGGANVVAIVDKAKEEIKDLSLPKGYKIETLRDQSVEIKHSVYSMLREALLGAVMAVIVTLVFLRNIRSTLIAVISIPLSILASLLLMKAMVYTLNIMTLAGIAVAVGRVVDDSIVVIENVFRRVRGSKVRDEQLIEKATMEVAAAITSSTITTVAVFMPLAFVPGIVGGFFKPLAWTIVISLLISLIVAITIVPLLSKMFLLNLTLKEPKENGLQVWYRKGLNWVLKNRLITLVAALLLLVASVAIIAPKLGTTFLPQEDVRDFDVNITMEKGTAPEKTAQAANEVENILLDHKGIDLIHTNIYGKSKNATVSFTVKKSVDNVNDFVDGLRSKFTKIPGPENLTVSGVGGIIGGAENEFMLVVNGSNKEDIQTATEKITAALQKVNGLTDVNSSLEGGEPEIFIELDEDKLAEKGLMPAMVAQSLRTLINGDVITTMRMDGEAIDVNLGLKMDQVTSLKQLGKQKISNMMGMPVALNEIGKVKKANHISTIAHLNGNEYAMVRSTITDDKVGNVTAKADETLDKLQLPKGVSYYKEGASASMSEGFRDLSIAIIISIFLVYLVMVFAFKEGKAPFVILFAIPFSVIGALIGLYLVKEPIGIPTMIGLLMLNGIVVTNAIVLIDKVKQNERAGMLKHEALIEAGVIRIRPILMTAIATIGALLPMAFSNAAGLVSKSLSVVVIGGLTTSTFLTLFIVPILYSFFNPTRKNNKKSAEPHSVQN